MPESIMQKPTDSSSLCKWEAVRKGYKQHRKEIAARPLAPLAYLEIYPKPDCARSVADADSILSRGWSMGSICLDLHLRPMRWNGHPHSFEFHLNAWLPVQRLLLAFDLSRSWRYFEAALDLAEDWIDACPVQLAGLSLEEALTQVNLQLGEGSWWYDMAIAQRLHRLAYIVDACSRNPDIDDNRLFRMMDHILLHHLLLDSDRIFKRGTNHGFFQALNQHAAIQRLPEFDCEGYFKAVSQRRLAEMTAQQYTRDMVHLEHSPGYHYMITVALMNANRENLLTDNERSGLRQAQENMGWMIMPSGYLVTFGDTDPRKLNTAVEAEFFEESSLVRLLKGEGKPPLGVKHFAEAGYAFARLTPPKVEPTSNHTAYLGQTAAFHSRAHKQADQLSFIWFDQGREILIDPARYGYVGKTHPGSILFDQGFTYSDPKRIYCESTRSHNTVEIDGMSFPRAKVKPFGSALLYAFEEEGRAVTYCEATHFRHVRHHRQLIMGPGRFLLVLDWLNDHTGATHDYRQFFHFAADWQVTREEDQLMAHHPGNENLETLDIRVTTLIDGTEWGPVVRGQEEPELLGWLSDKANSLIPTSCFHLYQQTSGPVSFATLFVLGSRLVIDRKATRCNASLSAGQIVWQDDQGMMVLSVRRPTIQQSESS